MNVICYTAHESAIFFNTDENSRGDDGAEAKIKSFENRIS